MCIHHPPPAPAKGLKTSVQGEALSRQGVDSGLATMEQRVAAIREAKAKLAALKEAAPKLEPLDIVDWAETNFWLPDLRDPANPRLAPRRGLIIVPEHMKTILRYMFDPARDMDTYFQLLIVSTIKKSAKCLSLDTILPTPSGWTTIGEVEAGDTLFDENGKQCRVLLATDPMEGHRCFKVHFSDGSYIIADDEHYWVTESPPKYEPRLRTTVEIASTLSWSTGVARNHRVRVCGPLEIEEQRFPVHPYVLGVWLGDGHSGSAQITKGELDAEVITYLSEYETVRRIPKLDRTDEWRVGSGTMSQFDRDHSLQARLRELGVLGRKHIPGPYLRGSFDQRISLLQGLMDTDGTISRNGNECAFSTTLEEMASGVKELVLSLGLKPAVHEGRATLYGKDCGPAWKVSFFAPKEVPVFRLLRKRDRQVPDRGSTRRSRNRHIVDVEEVESVPVKCIMVDSPSHMYLAGESMIPTHNTLWAALVGRYIAENWGPYSDVVLCANDYEQAKGRIYEAIKKSIELDPRFDNHRDELVVPLTQELQLQAAALGKTLTATNYILDNQGHYDNLGTPAEKAAISSSVLTWWFSQHALHYEPTNSVCRALAKDYKGEAGANQSAAIFTEPWGYAEERARRLYDELTPPPTRRSIRFLEGYAGFEGESELWQELWEQFRDIHDPEKLAPGSRRVTRSELEPYGGWPFGSDRDPLGPPLYVNEAMRACAYIDQGPAARRMPWQTPAYYEAQARTERQYSRLHENQWSSAVSEFIPEAWWDACEFSHRARTDTAVAKWLEAKTGWKPLLPDGSPNPVAPRLPPLDQHTSLVLGVDGSVSGDCTALVAVQRAPWAAREILVRSVQLWEPAVVGELISGTGGQKRAINYRTTIIPALHKFVNEFVVECVAYDPTQMHQTMLDLMRGGGGRSEVDEDGGGEPDDIGVWCYEFNQARPRNEADYGLYVMIRDRLICHTGSESLKAHMRNAAAKQGKDEDNRLRVVKKATKSRIDAVVALSMATYQCLYLSLD